MKISIIIPIYNSEKYLKKCLDSIINQTFDNKDIEVILINDGSTDNSSKVAQQYTKKLNCIYVEQKNKGQSYARNVGIKKATGEYITFVDSDDYIDSTMLEKLYELAKNEKLDIVTCNLSKDRNGKIEEIKDNVSDDVVKNYVLTKVGPCNMLIKRKFIEKIKFEFPTDLHKYEDIAIIPTFGMEENVKINHIDEHLYYYYDNTNSVMNSVAYTNKFDDIFISMDKLYNTANKKKNFKLFETEIEYLYIRHLIMSAGLRYARFNDPENKINEIKKVMYDKFPNWKNNKYLKKSSLKYKLTSFLIMNNMKRTIKLLDKIRGVK